MTVTYRLIDAPDPREQTLVLNGIPIFSARRTFMALVLDAYRIANGQLPHDRRMKYGFSQRVNLDPRPASCGGVVVTISGHGVLVDPDIAAILPHIPGLSFCNGYVAFSYSLTNRRGQRYRYAGYLHHVVARTKDGIRYANGNKNDVRRENIMPTPGEKKGPSTLFGKSRFMGVSPMAGRWRAQIGHEGEVWYLGTFPTEEEAARAWDAEALRLRGPETRLNFPTEGLDGEPA